MCADTWFHLFLLLGASYYDVGMKLEVESQAKSSWDKLRSRASAMDGGGICFQRSAWHLSPVIILAVILASIVAGSTAGPAVATFSEPEGQRLQHLVVDKHSALVYVGGVNHLYQLSPDLERQVTVVTGPRDDSPECPAVDCLNSVIKRPTDNVNKALVIDYTDTRLIACGTLFQGKIF